MLPPKLPCRGLVLGNQPIPCRHCYLAFLCQPICRTFHGSWPSWVRIYFPQSPLSLSSRVKASLLFSDHPSDVPLMSLLLSCLLCILEKTHLNKLCQVSSFPFLQRTLSNLPFPRRKKRKFSFSSCENYSALILQIPTEWTSYLMVKDWMQCPKIQNKKMLSTLITSIQHFTGGSS